MRYSTALHCPFHIFYDKPENNHYSDDVMKNLLKQNIAIFCVKLMCIFDY